MIKSMDEVLILKVELRSNFLLSNSHYLTVTGLSGLDQLGRAKGGQNGTCCIFRYIEFMTDPFYPIYKKFVGEINRNSGYKEQKDSQNHKVNPDAVFEFGE